MRLSARKPLAMLAVLLTAGTLAASVAHAEPGTYGKEHHKEYHKKDHEGCEGKHKDHKHGDKQWIKDLTDEQKTEMKRLKVELKKELASLEAALKLKETDARKTVASDNPDRKAISRLASEISGLKAKALETRYDHMIKVRSLLTPEQKLEFDASVLAGDGHGWKR
ncbi:Spy/CpxP family protein refolding chaperone [bacterium]|nr:Spy/CpxP family protein refolding chaperone [bacterium]